VRLHDVTVVTGPGVRADFDEVYARHFAPMVRLAYVTTGSVPAAEDVAQEVFVALLHRPDVLEPGAWLRRAVVSRCTSWVRRRRLERRHAEPQAPLLVGLDRYRLAGQAAWSPDGSRLAFHPLAPDDPGSPHARWWPQRLAVLPLTADAPAAGAPAGGGPREVPGHTVHGLLGWRGDEAVLVHDGRAIAELPLAGGAGTPLATLRPGDDHFVSDVQVAPGLVAQLRTAPLGTDRGPWPWWRRVAALLAAAAALGVGLLLRRRTRAR
jgi:hypothetical protein